MVLKKITKPFAVRTVLIPNNMAPPMYHQLDFFHGIPYFFKNSPQAPNVAAVIKG